MLDELLNESWAFQEILQKGVEQGLQEGLKRGQEEGLKRGQEEGLKRGQEEGLKRGQEEGLQKGLELSRRTLIALVENHYPALVRLAKEKADAAVDLDALQNLILQVSLATNEKEVHAFLQ